MYYYKEELINIIKPDKPAIKTSSSTSGRIRPGSGKYSKADPQTAKAGRSL